MNNAKELNTMPVNFPVELINDLIEQYKFNESMKVMFYKEYSIRGICKKNNDTIHKVLIELNVDPDEQ